MATATSWLRYDGFLLLFELCNKAATKGSAAIRKIIIYIAFCTNFFPDCHVEITSLLAMTV
ncbi:hypothetical protein [Rickettsia endosymbiont of Orchestes rusci]|uniref:hypothetical protein n=1 Tax=Rickettsia endosymbiont of Orchestes rusci TaxID=3066250 RepID=UPI00313C5ACF